MKTITNSFFGTRNIEGRKKVRKENKSFDNNLGREIENLTNISFSSIRLTGGPEREGEGDKEREGGW